MRGTSGKTVEQRSDECSVDYDSFRIFGRLGSFGLYVTTKGARGFINRGIFSGDRGCLGDFISHTTFGVTSL